MNQHDENIEVMKDLRARLDSVINKEDVKESSSIYPDAVKHKYVSFAKSAVRIAAGAALIAVPLEPWTTAAGVLIIIAEILGIVEEIV